MGCDSRTFTESPVSQASTDGVNGANLEPTDWPEGWDFDDSVSAEVWPPGWPVTTTEEVTAVPTAITDTQITLDIDAPDGSVVTITPTGGGVATQPNAPKVTTGVKVYPGVGVPIYIDPGSDYMMCFDVCVYGYQDAAAADICYEFCFGTPSMNITETSPSLTVVDLADETDAWSGVENDLADNAAVASARVGVSTLNTSTLQYKGPAGIPSDATVNYVRVNMTDVRKSAGTAGVRLEVQLQGADGNVLGSKQVSGEVGGTNEDLEFTFSPSVTAADVNDADFGFRVNAYNLDAVPNESTIQIRFTEYTVGYTEA